MRIEKDVDDIYRVLLETGGHFSFVTAPTVPPEEVLKVCSVNKGTQGVDSIDVAVVGTYVQGACITSMLKKPKLDLMSEPYGKKNICVGTADSKSVDIHADTYIAHGVQTYKDQIYKILFHSLEKGVNPDGPIPRVYENIDILSVLIKALGGEFNCEAFEKQGEAIKTFLSGTYNLKENNIAPDRSKSKTVATMAPLIVENTIQVTTVGDLDLGRRGTTYLTQVVAELNDGLLIAPYSRKGEDLLVAYIPHNKIAQITKLTSLSPPKRFLKT